MNSNCSLQQPRTAAIVPLQQHGSLHRRQSDIRRPSHLRPCQSDPQRAKQCSAVAHAEAESGKAASEKPADQFIANALELWQSAAPAQQSAGLETLNQSSREGLRTVHMPTRRTEEFRFTDLASITQSHLQVATGDITAEQVQSAVEERALSAEQSIRVVLRDGIVDVEASSMGGLPDEAYIGPLANAEDRAAGQQMGQLSQQLGGTMALLNGAAARDILCISLPAGTMLEQPFHIIYLSTESYFIFASEHGLGLYAAGSHTAQLNASAPRTIISLGAGASAEVIEDFGPAIGGGSSFTNAVTEVVLGEGASLRHGYLQLEADGAAHIKGTFVRQEVRSSYTLTEACLGGRLARHDINVEQAGDETSTTMRHFVLAGKEQVHDVHSKLRLQHPRGQASQLHKCIVSSASGRGVFDGNVKVERLAQQTDAQQLTRSLLLVPRATVYARPNLQIIADDVKCTHGCTVSDLEESQLFYLRSRGIDADTARQILVFSFGAEVTQHFKHERLQKRLQAAVNSALATAVAD